MRRRKDDSHLPARERHNWGYSQWVIDGWRKWGEESGATERANRMREGLRAATEIANDTSLTLRQRIRKIRGLQNRSGI